MAGVAAATTVWRRSKSALARVTPRSVVFTTLRDNETLRLEGAAVLVWLELEQPATDEILVHRVADRLAADPAEVRNLALAARRELVEIGALVESDD